MSARQLEWRKVFLLAIAEKKKILIANPNLSQKEATKKSWEVPHIRAARDDYRKKYNITTAKKKPTAKKKNKK